MRRIGVVSASAGGDRRAFSGAIWHMCRALEQWGTVVPLGPAPAGSVRLFGRARSGLAKLAGRRFDWGHTHALAEAYRRHFTPRVKDADFNFLFAPVAATELARLPATAAPVVYLSDTTIRLLKDYYPSCTRLLESNASEGDEIERAALHRADVVVVPSKWAADSVTRDYGVSPGRVHVIPFGANVESVPTRERALECRSTDTIELVFVGVDWKRKGGDVALQSLRVLRSRGVDARLCIIGCRPPRRMPDGVTVVEWIDKASPADRARYEAILLRSHLLILPTRADCFAIVVAEANAHGLPALVTDTGGMSGAITPGENGDLMAAGASPEEWADAIVRIVSDRQRYHGRCDAARNAYERRLNWSSWADSLQGVVRGLADR